MILRMENSSQWREVVWRLKFLPESGRKVAGKHHFRGWGAAGHVKREGGKKIEKALKFISCKALKNTWM